MPLLIAQASIVKLGKQTYQRVHVEATRNVVRRSARGGRKKDRAHEFLRAGQIVVPYHESKWAAEEIS